MQYHAQIFMFHKSANPINLGDFPSATPSYNHYHNQKFSPGQTVLSFLPPDKPYKNGKATQVPNLRILHG